MQHLYAKKLHGLLKAAICLLAFASITLSSCKKGSDEPTGSLYLPTRIHVAGEDPTEDLTIEYNSANFVTKLSSFGNVLSVTYNSNNQPVKMESRYGGQLSATEVFTVNAAGQVTRTDISYPDEPTFNGYLVHHYNSGGLLTASEYFNTANELQYSLKYGYDAAGNITNTIGDSSDNGFGTGSYQYDTHKGVFKNIPYAGIFLPYEFVFYRVNNVTKFTDGTDPSNLTTLSYEFNSADYPTKVTDNTTDNGTQVSTITYMVR